MKKRKDKLFTEKQFILNVNSTYCGFGSCLFLHCTFSVKESKKTARKKKIG